MKIAETHLTSKRLQRGLSTGFDSATSLRILIHLGRRCAVCSQAVTAFTGQKAGAADKAVATGASGSVGTWPDPVVLALRRWIGVLRNDSHFPVVVTPSHLFWAERLPSDPQVFCRVAIEEAFLATFMSHGDAGAREGFRSFVETLDDPAFEQLGTGRWHDARAVAHAFLSYALRGDWAALLEQEALTRGHLKEGSGDSEVHAVALLHLGQACEFTYGYASDRFDYSEAEQHLLRYLETTRSPGHLADLRVSQGGSLYWRNELPRALEKLTQALPLIPAPCKWLRFFTVCKLARLGIRLGNAKLVERHLLEAEKLAKRYFDDEQGVLFHLRGQVEMEAGRFPLAEGKLREALGRFRRAGWRDRTVHVLRDLRTLYLRTDRAEDLTSLRADLRALFLDDGRPWDCREKCGIFLLAEELEDLPWVREQLKGEEMVD